MGSHAATCESCGRAIREAISLDRMSRDVRMQIEVSAEDEHLTDDELMASADGWEGHDAHLAACETCLAERDAIARFKKKSEPRDWMPLAIAATVTAIAITIFVRNRGPIETPIPPGVVTTSSSVVEPPPGPAVVSTRYARPEWDAWVADVKERRALPMPAIIAELRPKKSQLRGDGDNDDLRLSPDHAVVASARPQFQWARRKGASYSVILQDGDEIVESVALADPRWKPRHDLKRGREYLWQVELTIDGARSIYPKAPDPPARFRILEQSALDEIEDARKRYPDDCLLQTVILAKHGLRDETLVEL
ncbi:MAG TPA: hypothetical protein VF608_04020, partial [Thermoanaerobaculia bacterium]